MSLIEYPNCKITGPGWSDDVVTIDITVTVTDEGFVTAAAGVIELDPNTHIFNPPLHVESEDGIKLAVLHMVPNKFIPEDTLRWSP